jgi:hypothetical protein
MAHDAHSGDNLSLHVTAGALCYTWADLLLELVADKSLNHPAFRKALPPGFAAQDFDRKAARDTLKNLLQQLSESPELDPILDRFVDEFVSACPPLLRGQMAQSANLDSLTIRSVVGARPGAIFHLRTNGASASVACYGRTISFPSHTAEALRFALGRPQFTVSELPCDLDDEGKLTLVRRLIREGLMLVLSA